MSRMSQEFPFGPAFKAAMGRVTAFPDGSEAVMIDSALALEAFQQDYQMVIEFMSMLCNHNLSEIFTKCIFDV